MWYFNICRRSNTVRRVEKSIGRYVGLVQKKFSEFNMLSFRFRRVGKSKIIVRPVIK